MAAPTIPSSKKKANLSASLTRDNTPKVTRKNILCPVSQEWPRASKTVEESILAKLTDKLTSVVNVFKPIKKSSTEDKPEKARIRSQLEIGTSCVFRSLEQGTLACILVSGQATPAIAVDHIISLGQERGCPLLCLDQLAPAIARATKTKCLPLAVGFKKMEDDSQSDFTEIISLVKENVTVQSPCSTHLNISTTVVANRENVTRTKASKYQPIRINTNMEEEILIELKRIFSEALVVTVDKVTNVKKKKKQKKKRNLKDVFDKAYHCQFDIGKRTVTGILERGKLQLILVTEQILPVLLSEAETCSLLSIAAMKKCPVVVLPGLMDIMRAFCGGMVSVLGLKKINSLQDGRANFQPVIDKCLLAVNSLDKKLLSPPESAECTSNMETITCREADGQSLCQDNEDKPVTNIDKDITERGSTLVDPDNEEAEEDYSYLYIMKKDSKELAVVKHELDTIAENTKNIAFSEDYISLTSSSGKSDLKTSKSPGKHKIHKSALGMNDSKRQKIIALNSVKIFPVEAKLVGEESSPQCMDNLNPCSKMNTSSSQNAGPDVNNMKIDKVGNRNSSGNETIQLPLFSVCRSGDNISSNASLKKTQHNEGQLSAKELKDKHALGMKELPQLEDKTKSIDYLSLEASSKREKKAQKRSLQKDDSYISFAYTESNIRTMTSNPSKKKKKKKKKT